MHRRKKVDEKSCVTFLLCDPGTSIDVQTEWEENTHTHTRHYTTMGTRSKTFEKCIMGTAYTTGAINYNI